MAANRSNAEIASELFIALSTVKTHINHILRKLGQRTRVGAILEYQRLTGASQPRSAREIHPGYDSGGAPND
jgi:DNA-binding CsgD family transcriptional regulator